MEKESLGGGFKYFLYSSYLGKISILTSIVFRWVGSSTNQKVDRWKMFFFFAISFRLSSMWNLCFFFCPGGLQMFCARCFFQTRRSTPPTFNSSPLKSDLPNTKVVFQPPFLRGYIKLQGCSGFQEHLSNCQVPQVPKKGLLRLGFQPQLGCNKTCEDWHCSKKSTPRIWPFEFHVWYCWWKKSCTTWNG